MKKLLIISFDLIREGESKKSLAISSILAYLKNDIRYGDEFVAEHLPIDMFSLNKESKVENLHDCLSDFDFSTFDFIALSAYIWNEYLTNDLISCLRNEFGFKGSFILGGYQISYSGNPEVEYPDCQYFISGYAEESLLAILTGKATNHHLNLAIDFTKIPSPYLSGELPVSVNQKMVRLETKRGCPYRCSFCAHRDLTFNKVYKHSLEKVYEEISLFKELEVGKINIVDPIFNAGKEYLSVMTEMDRINLSSLISIQARFETIKGGKGTEFLDSCERLNFNLEFGLQTAVLIESKIINRKNNPEEIQRVMKELKGRGINYEISLIYGLPFQTLDSFKHSIDFALENGCTNLTAYPLMLLKGTELYQQKEQFEFKEKAIGAYNIPVVVKSNTFSENEWYEMKALAESLRPNQRV